jgi:hypothetical protein
MKKIVVIITALCISISLFAQKTDKIALKLNAAVLVGIVNPSVELYVHDHFSVQLEGWGLFYPKGFLWTKYPIVMSNFFAEAHWYPKETFHGFYVGPNIGWGVWKLSKGLVPAYWGSYPQEYQVGTNLMVGATLGYQFCFGKHWGLDISWGLGYSYSQYEGHKSSDGSMYVGWNASGEWLPAYKGAVNVVYRW